MILRKKIIRSIAAITATLSMLALPIASANAEEIVSPPYPEYTGWVVQDGEHYWFDSGTMARSKEIYDPSSNAWYWLDADGTMARNKDVYQRSNGGKWVRYDSNGHMIKGEDCRYGGWYYFDQTTGAMAKGMKYIGSNGGKWVYYDWTTGKMAHGEQYVNYDAQHTGWYLFDQYTGAMFHGDTYIRSNGGKWVRYDRVTGKMIKGLHYQDGAYYYFDQTTGAMAHGRVWVSEWNSYATFDSVSGRYVSKDSGNNNPGNTGGENIRGRFCKKSEKGQQRIDGDGTLIVCECRNGNNTPHWYAK